MTKAILAEDRVKTKLELDKLILKAQMMSNLYGITHNVDVGDVSTGGYVVDVWVEQRDLDNGNYRFHMLSNMHRLPEVQLEYDRQCLELEMAAVDAMADTEDAAKAATQVAQFFGLK